MPNNELEHLAWNVTAAISAVSSVNGATAQQGAVANRKHIITHFSGSSDLATVYTIESPTGTILWRKSMRTANNSISENFDPGILVDTVNQAVLFKNANGAATQSAEVNGGGYSRYSG